MKIETTYEWCIEYTDNADEVIELNHSDTLNMYVKYHFKPLCDQGKVNLVLIRSRWDVIDQSLFDRWFAYIEDNKLPEFFERDGFETNIKVPKKFHKEFTSWIKKK